FLYATVYDIQYFPHPTNVFEILGVRTRIIRNSTCTSLPSLLGPRAQTSRQRTPLPLDWQRVTMHWESRFAGGLCRTPRIYGLVYRESSAPFQRDHAVH